MPLLPVYAFGETQLFRTRGPHIGHQSSLWMIDSPADPQNQDSGLGSTHQSIFLQETSKKMVKGREIDEKLLRLMDHKYHNQDEKQKT